MAGYPAMSFELETPRLSMRLWTQTDAGGYLALVRERDGRTADPERGDISPTRDTIRERIFAQLASTRQTGLALLPIFRRIELDFIGYCGLTVGRASADEPEIAYELLRSAHGLGYATEAAHAVVDAAIATGRRRLWSTVRTWNTPSFRVLDKLGFHRDRSVVEDDRGELVWMTRRLP